MTYFQAVQDALAKRPQKWLITGVAGFIGSNLLERLLKLNQTVIGLDNFLTGKEENLKDALSQVTPRQAAGFTMVAGDIRDLNVCRSLCQGVDAILHQAALGSVPRSVANPAATHENNLDGFLNVLLAAKDAGVKRFVYASSSSVYGDYDGLPKEEDKIGRPLSPYAVTKLANELYAGAFGRLYGIECIGLRYFNIFGPRQDPDGPYAAVIPRWFRNLLHNETIEIYGDGETTRDFTYIENAIAANLLAATTNNKHALGQVYNIAYGRQTSLNNLYQLIRKTVINVRPNLPAALPKYLDTRAGDIRHSWADIRKASELLGYQPIYSLEDGLRESAEWYLK